jgi:hypothetical protein
VAKLLLVSIVFATIVLPLRAASEPSPSRALRRVLVSMFAFNVIYLIAILYVYPRLP